MPRIFTLLFLFFVGSIAAQVKLKSELPLADQSFKNCNGTDLTLRQALGENGLVLVFSCNTCPFVVGTPDFPGWERQYNDLYNFAKEQKVGFVLLNSNEAKRDKADSFSEMEIRAKTMSYLMPYLVDEKSALANALEAKTTPHVFLFDKDLKLIYSGSIDNIWDNKRKKDIPYLKNAIIGMVLNNKIQFKETPPRGCSIKRVSNP
ncbi:MAG: hypothetical protein RL264_353 [Bacteroidota bacterium]|jgi:thioredoxin-related protein